MRRTIVIGVAMVVGAALFVACDNTEAPKPSGDAEYDGLTIIEVPEHGVVCFYVQRHVYGGNGPALSCVVTK